MINPLSAWTPDPLVFVFFIYGLAFLTMGVAIWLTPKRESIVDIAEVIWLLGAFGVIHGANEWLDLYANVAGAGPVLDRIRWSILMISYCFLFEFGRRLVRLDMTWHPPWLRWFARLLVPWYVPAIMLLLVIIAVDASDVWRMNTILTRYLLGFPGSVLCGIGFLVCFRKDRDLLRKLRIKAFPAAAALSFLAYAVFGGLIVPKGSFFPSTWLNTESFLAFIGTPVEVFRAACAVIIAVLVCRMLKIFKWSPH